MNGVFYARLPKWDEVNGAPGAIEGTEPHEIDRLFFARCRMEPAWSSVDFTVDISDSYSGSGQRSQRTHQCSRVIRRVWSNGTQQRTRSYGSLLGVRYAEPFQARSPLLVSDPTAFAKAPFG